MRKIPSLLKKRSALIAMCAWLAHFGYCLYKYPDATVAELPAVHSVLNIVLTLAWAVSFYAWLRRRDERKIRERETYGKC